MDLTKLSGNALQARYDRLLEKDISILREIIAAGHGNKRHSDIKALAEDGDKLAIKAVKSHDAFHAVADEMHRRRHWHGNIERIKPSKFWNYN